MSSDVTKLDDRESIKRMLCVCIVCSETGNRDVMIAVKQRIIASLFRIISCDRTSLSCSLYKVTGQKHYAPSNETIKNRCCFPARHPPFCCLSDQNIAFFRRNK